MIEAPGQQSRVLSYWACPHCEAGQALHEQGWRFESEDNISVTAADILARSGSTPLTQEEFDKLFGDLPTDDEG